jgi:AAA domain
LIAACVAQGRAIGKRETEQGRVLFFVGENPDDTRMRWIAMSQHLPFDVATIQVNFIPGVFKMSEMLVRIRKEIENGGEVSLVIVDTSAAYFEGDDPNNNKQQWTHAVRFRSLTNLPGGPCVVVNCHPIKNALEDRLVPYGGGSFLNEMDGNLTASVTDGGTVLHWQGKFRGPDFAPMTFAMRTITHGALKDTKGRLIPTVVADVLTETAQEEMAAARRSANDNILLSIADDPTMSLAARAKSLGLSYKTGEPDKSTITRAIKSLKKSKLVTGDIGDLELTPSGRKRIEKLKVQTSPRRDLLNGGD